MERPSPSTRSRLSVMLAASRFGMTSRLARPFRRELGNSRARICSSRPRESALHLAFDLQLRIALQDQAQRAAHLARRIGTVALPKLECDSRAAFGTMPKRRSQAADMDRALGDLLLGRVGGDIGIGQEEGAGRSGCTAVSGRIGAAGPAPCGRSRR